MMRSGSTLLVLLAGACSPAPVVPPYAGDLPHIVVVTIDTLRADHLGCYGYFRDTSPTIDAFAREAVLFEQCVVPVAQTLPSHTSLFTGLNPYEHGVLANVFGGRVYELGSSVQTFASALAEAGYSTAAFVASRVLERGNGLEGGFAGWWEPEGQKAPAEVVVDAAIDGVDEWAREQRDRPLMMWVHLFDPHASYDPPAPFDSLFSSDAELDAWIEERRISEFVESRQEALSGDARTEHNNYDGEIRYVDEHLARLFEKLRSIGVWDDALVVLTSDHGEALKQHDSNSHGGLWLEQMRVPCIVMAPGIEAARIDVPIAMIDVLPTAIAKVPPLHARIASWLEGVAGQDVLAEGFVRDPVLGQYPANNRHVAHSIIRDGWRLIFGVDETLLFRLDEDPHELNNLALDHPALVAELSQLIEAEIEEQKAAGVRYESGGTREASEERLRDLEALGYGGDEED